MLPTSVAGMYTSLRKPIRPFGSISRRHLTDALPASREQLPQCMVDRADWYPAGMIGLNAIYNFE